MAKKKAKYRKQASEMHADEECCKKKRWNHHAGCGGIYGMGFIGALIYYISTATGFWIGVLKALVWPAFLVYEALKFLGA